MTDKQPMTDLRAEATRLAGGLRDLAQRAMVYHHIYRHSGGNHVFPLLAAHGALWAGGYFRRGMLAGAILSLWRPDLRADRLAALHRFADAFREINRQVCVETYYIYHLTRSRDRADQALARATIPTALRQQMRACHMARRRGRRLPQPERRALFHAFFSWEQDLIVGPAVTRAFASFPWRLINRLARRPDITFRYLLPGWRLKFCDFSDQQERIDKGLEAFSAAESAGWDRVERTLEAYGPLPRGYTAHPGPHLSELGLA